MNSCLDTLDRIDGWEDDLEIEALPSVQSATVVPALVFFPWWIHNGLTTVIAPPYESIYSPAA